MKCFIDASHFSLFLYCIASLCCLLPRVKSFAPSEQCAPSVQRTGERAAAPTQMQLSTVTSVTEVGGIKYEKSSTSEIDKDKASFLKKQFMDLSDRTKRGFNANQADRREANRIINELSKINPTKEPAREYYNSNELRTNDEDLSVSPSVKGKWKLIYTDAPDITGLDQNPFAQLGRIGQECSPPYIKNVIEYTRPSWASNLPFSGNEKSRVLQKVITKASATSDRPTKVKLEISGLEIIGSEDTAPTEQYDTTKTGRLSLLDLSGSIQRNGIVAGIFQSQPLAISGPIEALPFGEFEILYLDDEFRIIRTGQNYIAVNIREEWF